MLPSILNGQTSLQLINDDGVACDQLDLKENDPILTLTFEQMISEAFQEGKHFFIAKITSR